MELAVRRPMLAAAALTTVGALAFSPILVTPQLHAPTVSPAAISTQAVQLTDAWSDLVTHTAQSVVNLAATFAGYNNNIPLPSPTIFAAPIVTQLALNGLIYAVQLFTGQGAQIPTEIIDHINKIGTIGQMLATDLPPALIGIIQTPFAAVQLALDSITTSTNQLLALIEAPALFLDVALNSDHGLLGLIGPIGIPIIIRNTLALGIATPLPALPFKKAAATPKAATTTTTPSGTASSARSKPKAPASSSRKAASAKSTTKAGSGGSGRSARG